MNQIKNSLIAFGGLSLLIGAIALATPRPTQGQADDTVGPTKPVKVVNTAAEPVPVTGSVTGDVNVVNTVRVTDVARQPINERIQLSFSETQDLRSEDVITVPPGKQLVVTYVSANAFLPDGQTVSFSVRAGDSFDGVLHSLVPITFLSSSSFVASEPLQLYLDAGRFLSVIVRRSAAAGTANATVNVSGYLVDVP